MLTHDWKGKILVVDDTPATIGMVKTILEDEGYEVIVATTGEKALKRAELTRPDLILLDVCMPDMDGFETCRRLKASERTRKIPVIFMTSLTATADKVTGFEVGGVDYVTKPIELEEILARVGTHLSLKKMQQELHTHNQRLHQEISERKRVGQNIALLNFALNNVCEAAFLIDENARFHFVNEESCRILGYTRAELLGLGVPDIDPDFPMSRWINHWNTLKTQRSLLFESRHQAKGGRIFPVEINVNYFEYDRQGYNLALVRDITERKRAEEELRQYQRHLEELVAERTTALEQENIEHKRMKEALRESEERYRSLFCNSHTVMLLIDPETGRIMDANPAACTYYGYSQNDLTAKKIMDINTLTNEHVFEKMRRARLEQQNHFEFRHRLANAEIRDVEVYSGPIQFQNKQLLYSIIHDITIRKQAEEALRKAKEEWERTFDALPELIAIIDTHYRIVRVNKAMTDSLKLPPADCVGVHCYQVVHRLDAPPAYCPHQQVLQNRQTHTAEVFEKCLGGNFLITVSPLFDSHANLFGSVHIARNIDDRKRFEEQLQHTAEAANAANRAKSEFLANMSHEIRTPMNAILGFAEILEGKITDTQQRQYVSLIRASGKTLLRLINDILDLSKIEAGKLDLHYGAVNARLVCQEVAQIFSQKISEKGLDFVSEVDPELPQYLSLDEIRLRQILLNLLGNAVKFTETGHVTLRAKVCSHRFSDLPTSIPSQDGVRSAEALTTNLQFEIEDTGIGIPVDQCDTIFGVFKQVHGQSRKYGGAGLGLVITKRLVEMMGGVISVTSAVGQGSTFTVRFPHVRRVEGSDHAAPPSTLPLETLQFDPATILIADDMPDNRLLLRSYLEEFGLASIEAANGQEAIDLATREHPALILMDMRMPAINGYDATQALKHAATTQDIPIIAVTATTMKETIAKVLALCDGYLSKPVEKATLVAELVKFLPHTLTPRPDQETNARCAAEGGIDRATLTPEVVQRLPEALRILETAWLPQWQTFRAAFIMDEVNHFAVDLKQFAQEYQLQILFDYAERLVQHSQSYDVSGLKKRLAEFPGLIEQLRYLCV